MRKSRVKYATVSDWLQSLATDLRGNDWKSKNEKADGNYCLMRALSLRVSKVVNLYQQRAMDLLLEKTTGILYRR